MRRIFYKEIIMSLILKRRPVNFDPAPAGLHHATCIRVIELGTQKSIFSGKVKIQAKLMIIWELHGVNQENGKPHIAAKHYTASLNEKANLVADINGWYGKNINTDEFNLRDLLGKPCAINIAHKPSKDGTRMYAEVKSVSPPMSGAVIPEPQTKPAAFDLSEPDWALFSEFSDHTRDTIRKSPEYAQLDLPVDAPPPINESTIPLEIPVNEELLTKLKENIQEGKMTFEEILSLGYALTDEQKKVLMQ